MPHVSGVSQDVRMRGFSARTLVETVVAWVDAHARALPGEIVALEQAHGRVLDSDVVAAIDVPAFDRAAMDGYALRGAETVGAGPYNPLSLAIIGEALPGRPFDGEVGPGGAVRIMTGAPFPAGADAVLPAEYAREVAGAVEAAAPIAPGKHVGRRGEDIRAGATLLRRGRRLRPQDVGLLASVGIDRVAVVGRPQVRIVVTGNELVVPGQAKTPHQIYDSNSSMLLGLIARDGGVLEASLKVADEREAIREAITRPGADIVLVSGGSSVGAEDHAPILLAEHGELAFHGIAMRPSSPTGMGKVGEVLVFLLPGNPVSCLCAYDFFAGRAIRLRAGRSAAWPYRSVSAALVRKVASAVGRVDYCRVRAVEGGIEPLALSGASILSSTSRADGFVIVPADSEGYAPGTVVSMYLYDPVS